MDGPTQNATDVSGRARVVIEGVAPEINHGRFPIKRSVGERVVVELDAFADGHDVVACALRYRKEGNDLWSETSMRPLGNDRWRASFTVDELGRYRYSAIGWIDAFLTWTRDMQKRVQARQDLTVPLQIGARLVTEAVARASGADASRLAYFANALSQAADRPHLLHKDVRMSRAQDAQERPSPPPIAGGEAEESRMSSGHSRRRTGASEVDAPRAGMEAGGGAIALSEELATLMARYPDRRFATTYDRELAVTVDRERARFSAWYEFFPRSCTDDAARHGRFRDCDARLKAAAAMGFDVVYLPPIHPIGHSHRKGPNNAEAAASGDFGSPWAIGDESGGHRAVHPQLGTLEEFRGFVQRANGYGLEVALDIAFQVSPDHPYVREHPEWFLHRPDGSIQYAENPPKKYQDIYPLHFETEAWQSLWDELTDVVLFWIGQGVHIFRVDNPHTKAFAFWEYLIDRVKRQHPDTIFLAEAFTRPKVMYRLAKLGFTQSYTYFTWRNTKWELTQYFTELTQTEVREYFRPNLWPNTPDILNEYLQHGGRPGFMARVALAATLGASYGIYGPAFELNEGRAREPGSEEYLDSEKYQIRAWPTDRPDNLRDYIGRLNRIRRDNPALHSDRSLRFHPIDNDMLICYSKWTEDHSNVVLVVVNLDPHHTQSGWLRLPLQELGFEPKQAFQAHDLLSDARYLWSGELNFVQLNPHLAPAHIFRLRKRARSERDFDYFL